MTFVPSPAEVEARKTPAGGWTRATLAEWGVPWPPPKGWREQLRKDWENGVCRCPCHSGGECERYPTCCNVPTGEPNA